MKAKIKLENLVKELAESAERGAMKLYPASAESLTKLLAALREKPEEPAKEQTDVISSYHAIPGQAAQTGHMLQPPPVKKAARFSAKSRPTHENVENLLTKLKVEPSKPVLERPEKKKNVQDLLTQLEATKSTEKERAERVMVRIKTGRNRDEAQIKIGSEKIQKHFRKGQRHVKNRADSKPTINKPHQS